MSAALAVIQWGMMPLLAQDFHRVSLAGPLSNIPAVILTGLIVPPGFPDADGDFRVGAPCGRCSRQC